MPPTSDYQMYIAGTWTGGESGARFTAYSPATGEPNGTIPEGTRADVRRAVAAAKASWPAWSRRSPFGRAGALERVAEIIAARRDALARVLTLDQGKPLHGEAYQEVDDVVEYFRMAAAD